MATPTGASGTVTVAITFSVAVSITDTEVVPLFVT